MDNQDRKIIEHLESAFHSIASQAFGKEDIERQDIEDMKDIQKIMYYMEVRCAMKEGEDYEDEEYINDMERSDRSYGNRHYNGYSGNMYSRGSGYSRGGYGRPYMRRGNSYMNNGTSGRRYYDGDKEKENSMNDLRQMLQMEQDPEKRSMLEGIMRTLENDK